MGSVKDPEGAEAVALAELADFDGKRVLEIGCGDGRLTWLYADRASTVLGIDTESESMGRNHHGCQLTCGHTRVAPGVVRLGLHTEGDAKKRHLRRDRSASRIRLTLLREATERIGRRAGVEVFPNSNRTFGRCAG